MTKTKFSCGDLIVQNTSKQWCKKVDKNRLNSKKIYYFAKFQGEIFQHDGSPSYTCLTDEDMAVLQNQPDQNPD